VSSPGKFRNGSSGKVRFVPAALGLLSGILSSTVPRMGLGNMAQAELVRVRRKARVQNLRVDRCRSRNPHALGYGTYRLVDSRTGRLVVTGNHADYGLSLKEVENFLDGKTVGQER
jgi:hypothetical protein